MNNDTIHYSGRDWRESEIWELFAALNSDGTDYEIWGTGGFIHVQLDGNGYDYFTNWEVHPGPSPWPALKAAVEGLKS